MFATTHAQGRPQRSARIPAWPAVRRRPRGFLPRISLMVERGRSTNVAVASSLPLSALARSSNSRVLRCFTASLLRCRGAIKYRIGARPKHSVADRGSFGHVSDVKADHGNLCCRQGRVFVSVRPLSFWPVVALVIKLDSRDRGAVRVAYQEVHRESCNSVSGLCPSSPARGDPNESRDAHLGQDDVIR
jgi:hypothetical protein